MPEITASSEFRSEASPKPVLSLSRISANFGNRPVFQHVDLQLNRGETASIMGASGSGKSTLLSCILGLTPISEGTISVDGQKVRQRNSRAMARLRRESIGMVFQSGHLLPELTPLENIVIAGLLAGMTGRAAKTRAAALLSGLGVPDSNRSVTEYSGGEQQRIAVARAMINSPALVLADEPTGSLDPENRNNVIDAIFSLPRELNCALVVVTHDPVVASYAEKSYILENRELKSNPLQGLVVSAHA